MITYLLKAFLWILYWYSSSANAGISGAHSGVLGIWGEWPFVFRKLGSTGNYLGDLGSKLIVLGI